MIKKKAALISALVMLCAEGCGRIDYSAEMTEETTDAEVTTTEEAFSKIFNALNDEFGEASLNNGCEGEGIDTEYTRNADGEEICGAHRAV